MEFNEMKECFKRCFAQYGNDDFSSPNDAKWIYAVVRPELAEKDEALKGFHYELIARGAGAGEEYYVELHFEMYKHQYGELRAALTSKFAEKENRRKILATSYFSSLMWRVRTPIFDHQDIVEDVDLLRTAVREVLEQQSKTMNSSESAFQDKPEEELVLPCPLSIGKIAEMLSEGAKAPRNHANANSLTIPSVQRGKVWNAARIETLWDSIFRGFPIGALSVWHNKEKPHAYELLDGQQRATAIALGFENFPDYDSRSRYDSILWIDLEACRGDDGTQYRFFVTTASQPWGYAESSSETRNSLLSASERRTAANALDKWEENQIKPYPFQLSPVKAKYPVPYTLLRQFAEENDNRTFVDFRKWLEPRINKFLSEILGTFTPTEKVEENFRLLCKKVSVISKDYTVFLLDASSVTENDIALYFTRIGKGGVVPSDEELAYSVLKSKLTPCFRSVIQCVHAKYGLASESRIAHLAIRLFKSESKKKDSLSPQFYSGSAFSVVMDMCKEENAAEKEDFADFIEHSFEQRVQTVEENYSLTQWHCARYASERNGDAFLLLLLAAGNVGLFGNCNVKGLAELLFGYASHIDYAVRKMLEQGVTLAIANLAKETYYGRPRLSLPIAPEKLDGIPSDSIDSLLKWKNSNSDVAQALAEGYSNSRNNHAYNILLYACRESELNNRFNYDPNLGLWSEENLPWDYDHIMPHSTIEKMTDPAQSICEWLKNSMGNLAPLPFSLNRKLSDSARNENYPCCDSDKRKQLYQKQLCLGEDGGSIASMWGSDGQIDPLKFCTTTIRRYRQIYTCWYRELGLDRLLDFRKALEEKAGPDLEIRKIAQHRYSVFSKIQSKLAGMNLNFTYKRVIADNREQEIREDELCREFCVDQVITLSQDVNGVSVALSKYGIRGDWEVGLRKCGDDSSTTKSTYAKVKMLLPSSDIDSQNLCKDGERWWYWQEEVPDQLDDLEPDLAKRLVALARFAERLCQGSE